MTHPTFRIMMNQEHKFKGRWLREGLCKEGFTFNAHFIIIFKWLFVFACINVGAMFHAFEYLRY